MSSLAAELALLLGTVRRPGDFFAHMRHLLLDIAAPTLVVCGSEDVPDFQLAAHAFVRIIPDARLAWLTPARHAAPLQQPEQFIRALTDFLAA